MLFLIINTNLLMLLVEILRVLSENRVDHITLCVDKVQTDVLNVVTG